MTDGELFALALKARENAYAPYSHFKVGAALLTAEGKTYLGCNVENSSSGATCCAERVALFKALSEGDRNFSAIAVAGGKDGGFEKACFPCGICRQALGEFCGDDFRIIVGDKDGYRVFTLGELLPYGFKLND